jgi:hypothetical protein
MGKDKFCERNHIQTWRAEPNSVNFAKMVRMTPVTASSGWERISPSPQPIPLARHDVVPRGPPCYGFRHGVVREECELLPPTLCL